MYAFHCMFPAFVAASQSRNGTTVEPLVKNYLYDSHQLPHLMLMTATDHLSWWLLIFLPDTVMTATDHLSWWLLIFLPDTVMTATDHLSWWLLIFLPDTVMTAAEPPPPPPPLTVSWQLLATPWHCHDSCWTPTPTPTPDSLMTTTGHLSWWLLIFLPDTVMTATDHLSWWLLIFLPDTVMTAAEPPSWYLRQLQTTPPDTHNNDWPPLLTTVTATDHSFWHSGQLLTPPPPPPPNMHNSYRPLLTFITMTTPIDNCDSYRPFLLTFMTMTDHPWHSWQQLATFRDIHGNNWPSLILMTISDLLSWHSWQVQTTPPDAHANYWPLFMTIYIEPWKIAGTVSIISCKLALAVGDSCLCCCVHCYMADVCWVQLMGVVYWVLLIPFVSEFVLA